MDNFNLYADYYDVLNQSKDYLNESNFIIKNYETYSSNKLKNILDLGCGTGKHAKEFVARGYEVYGVELSKTMIASGFQHHRYHTFNANIIDFKSPVEVELATSLFHVISYINKDSDLKNLFDSVAKNLLTSGLFIFDCWYQPAVDHYGTPSKTRIYENDILEVSRTSNSYKEDSNIIRVTFDISVLYKANNEIKEFVETHHMRAFSKSEISDFAKSSGMELLHSCEFLSGSELDHTTWGGCFVLKKN